MVSVEVLLTWGFPLAAGTIGYLAGVLKPILGETYQIDRTWCQRTSELYGALITHIENYPPTSVEGRSEQPLPSIYRTMDELDEQVSDYPNYRREERNRARKIVDKTDETISELKQAWKEEQLEENKQHLISEIKKADKDLSYGPFQFVRALIVGDRTL